MCLWHGPAAKLLGAALAPSTCINRGSIVDKAWLPPTWREQLGVGADAGTHVRPAASPSSSGDFASGLLHGMMIMFLSCAIVGLLAALLIVTARKRRVRSMGGAPTMSPSRHVVGDVVSVSSGGAAAIHPYAAPSTPSYVAPVATPIAATPTSSSQSSRGTAPLLAADSASASHV